MRHATTHGGRRRGSSLAVALVLITITSLTLVWLAQAALDHQRLNRRRGDLARALYAAEAGVALVQHFSNHPEDFSQNTNLFQIEIGETGPELFPAMAARLANGNLVLNSSDLEQMGFGPMVSQYGYEVARIHRIRMMLPDPGSDPISCFFKVESTGRTPSGVERTVLAYMNAHLPVLEIEIPGAMLSYNLAAAHGNARIFWGESWSKGDFNMLNKSQMNYLRPDNPYYDPYAAYRTEGSINFPDNWHWGEGKDLYDPMRTQPGADPAHGMYADAFYQHLPEGSLEWPEWDYDAFKEMAMEHGRYYWTDSGGNIYKYEPDGSVAVVDFYDEFAVPDRHVEPYDLVFIDTIDQQPPAPDGSNLATINISGTSNGTKGVMYICANMDATGVGSPPTLTMTDPDGDPLTRNIFHDGVIYTAGTAEFGGNASVYGSLITQRGFVGGGTPNIYYNVALKDGLEVRKGNVGSLLRVALQTNRGG